MREIGLKTTSHPAVEPFHQFHIRSLTLDIQQQVDENSENSKHFILVLLESVKIHLEGTARSLDWGRSNWFWF